MSWTNYNENIADFTSDGDASKAVIMFQMDDAWQPDEFLAEFDSEEFDVESHATEILRKGNINEEVAKLTASLQSLDTCIQTHVSEHYSDLLSRAVASSDLEQSLAVMVSSDQSDNSIITIEQLNNHRQRISTV